MGSWFRDGEILGEKTVQLHFSECTTFSSSLWLSMLVLQSGVLWRLLIIISNHIHVKPYSPWLSMFFLWLPTDCPEWLHVAPSSYERGNLWMPWRIWVMQRGVGRVPYTNAVVSGWHRGILRTGTSWSSNPWGGCALESGGDPREAPTYIQ